MTASLTPKRHDTTSPLTCCPRCHKAELLGRAEIYLSASLSDSTSVSLLEAMASCAVPVVSDIEGNREWVGEGEGARLFPPGDSAALARALEHALDDSDWQILHLPLASRSGTGRSAHFWIRRIVELTEDPTEPERVIKSSKNGTQGLWARP